MSVMRLLILKCLVNNGLPPKSYDPLRRSLVQVYGFQIIPIFDRLQQLRMELLLAIITIPHPYRYSIRKGDEWKFPHSSFPYAIDEGRHGWKRYVGYGLRYIRLCPSHGTISTGYSYAGRNLTRCVYFTSHALYSAYTKIVILISIIIMMMITIVKMIYS